MGSSASVQHGSGGGSDTSADHARPPVDDLPSPTSSARTDGRGGGGDTLPRSPAMARTRSRHALTKKLVKGRVIFLGLDGAGKTTLVTQLQRLNATIDEPIDSDERAPPEATPIEPSTRTPSPLRMLQSASSLGDLVTPDGGKIPRLFPDPTKATTSALYRLDGDRHVQFVDVPGRRAYRAAHWRAAFGGDGPVGSALTPNANASATGAAVPIVGVVFVVDATDHTRFPLVARELVAFQKLKDARAANGTPTPLAAWLQRAPFLMVLNKVDAAAAGTNGGLPDANSVERRRASRVMRQLIKVAFDHQLRMDQKSHPRDYAVAAAASESPAPALGASTGPTTTNGAVPSSSRKRAALAEVNSNRKTLLMTSLVECCAFDHDCVRAIHTLLRDDIRRLWSGAA